MKYVLNGVAVAAALTIAAPVWAQTSAAPMTPSSPAAPPSASTAVPMEPMASHRMRAHRRTRTSQRTVVRRATARQVVRLSPRRWRLRDTVQSADHQAVHVALLAVSVLQLARVVAPALDGCNWLPQPVHAVLAELVAAVALADTDPVAATEHAAAARRLASEVHSVSRDRREVVLADVVQSCIDDLQRVIDLRPA